MRSLLAILLAVGVIFALIGCGKEETKQTQTPAPAKEKSESAATSDAQTQSEDGFISTESGLQYKDTKVGTGPAVKVGDSVTVEYKGWLDNGTVFDSTKKPGAGPFSFNVGSGQVIKGWDEGLQGMKKGGVRQLILPPALGYGSEDMGTIPPNSTLHFEIELLKIGA
ncbi:FKBP-type peptidyl-prolyl cis-trans isomerase [bacterium]|nr:FKBP-type peptidyl-prolyl cis-trans isomerase [bacterium]